MVTHVRPLAMESLAARLLQVAPPIMPSPEAGRGLYGNPPPYIITSVAR